MCGGTSTCSNGSKTSSKHYPFIQSTIFHAASRTREIKSPPPFAMNGTSKPLGVESTELEGTGDGAQRPFEEYEDFLLKNDLSDDYNTSALYQVYEDLRLIRKWSNMRVVRSKTRTYIAGMAPAAFDSVFPNSEEEGVDRTQAILPMPAYSRLSPLQLEALCRECVHPETGARLRCVTIAIVDDDSTTAYYRVFEKWDEIVHPQWKRMKKRKEDEGQGTEERTGNEVEEELSSEDSEANSDSD